MNQNPLSMQKAHIAKLANKAVSKNLKEKKINHAKVFKETYPDYTIGEFVQDILVIGADGLTEAFVSLDVYTQQSVVAILEDCCQYADMIEQSEVLLSEGLLNERVRSYKDLVATREMLKKKKSGDKEGYMNAASDFVKRRRGDSETTHYNKDGSEKSDPKSRGTSVGYAHGRAGVRNFLSGNRMPDRKGVEAATQKFLDSSVGEKWQSIKNVMKKAVSHGVAAAGELKSRVRAALTKSKESKAPETRKPTADAPSSENKKSPKPSSGSSKGSDVLTRDQLEILRHARGHGIRIADKIHGAKKPGSANTGTLALRGTPVADRLAGSSPTPNRVLVTPPPQYKALPNKKTATVKPPRKRKGSAAEAPADKTATVKPPRKRKGSAAEAPAAPNVTVHVHPQSPQPVANAVKTLVGNSKTTLAQAQAQATSTAKNGKGATTKKTPKTGSAGAELWQQTRPGKAKNGGTGN